MKNDIRSYLAQHNNAQLVSSIVRGSLARAFVVRLAALLTVVGIGTALFFLVSPAAGFVALVVGIFLL